MTLREGLVMIARLGLPHPTWQFVRQGDELKRLRSMAAYAGWTVRTVEVVGARYQNLYANWLPRARVANTLDRFQRELKGRGRFVVYPSWR